MEKQFYTTFQVGEMCSVFHTTVINWVNKGQLKAYTTPGRHRRILRDDLLDFLKTFNFPIPKELSSDKRTVLLVDDDPAIIQLLEKTLKRQEDDLIIQSASNGVDALVKVGREKPDLIILDIVMPAMDGIEVCRRLKANPVTKNIKIICVSGGNLSNQDEIFLLEHVDAFFRKPFSPNKLFEKALTLVGLKEVHYEVK